MMYRVKEAAEKFNIPANTINKYVHKFNLGILIEQENGRNWRYISDKDVDFILEGRAEHEGYCKSNVENTKYSSMSSVSECAKCGIVLMLFEQNKHRKECGISK